jgi:hypothetical protein
VSKLFPFFRVTFGTFVSLSVVGAPPSLEIPG